MGGRRKSKQGQGPLPSLDEPRITSLKSRRSKAAGEGKKRKASGDIVRTSVKTIVNVTEFLLAKKGVQANNQPFVASSTPAKRPRLGKKTEPRTNIVPKSSDEEVFDAEDGLEDGSSLGSSLGNEIDLGDDVPNDDFLESGSSVYDSDQEQKQAIFSEDEDESDAEEKLTAANIEGLSRRLDDEKDAEAARAQLELEEAAIQTNIDGDKSKVLEDDSEEDGGTGVKTNLRLAPDLQLIRARMTETIRVLDDFSKLAEDGRSRAEYTAQFLKDVTAYYGYSPFLAEKLFNLFSPRVRPKFHSPPTPLQRNFNTQLSLPGSLGLLGSQRVPPTRGLENEHPENPQTRARAGFDNARRHARAHRQMEQSRSTDLRNSSTPGCYPRVPGRTLHATSRELIPAGHGARASRTRKNPRLRRRSWRKNDTYGCAHVSIFR